MLHRIIARLDIKGPNLVKGIHLEGLRVLGKPEEFAKYYFNEGIDELIYVDTVASLYGRNSLDDIISKTAAKIFIPLTVGGGIRSIEDIKRILRAGADKVALNTAAIKNPKIISEAANIFGSSTITVSIEALKQNNGEYLAYTDNGREYTGIEVVAWAKKVEKLGAGEILLTSIDNEGTGKGYDLELIKKVARRVSITTVACGGAGSMKDLSEAIIFAGADAVSVSSILHYSYIKKHKRIDGYEDEGNIEFLKNENLNPDASFVEANIESIKFFLSKKKIPVRLS